MFKKENISEFIAKKLIELNKQDHNKYKNFVLNFIKEYYKWTIFVCNNLNKNSLYTEDYIYLSLINLNELDTIIDYSLDNINFLKTIIDGYLFYSTSDKEISESIVEKYYKGNVDIKLQDKLNSIK